MKTELIFKFIASSLESKEEGFTLIELLVVVIILGIMSAIALPNFLGQIGKSREAEAKTTLGSLGRAQQAYHFERKQFYSGDSNTFDNAFGISPSTKYYNYGNATAIGNITTGVEVVANAKHPQKDGVRNFSVGVFYISDGYQQTLCVGDAIEGAVSVSAINTCSGGKPIK